MSEESVLLDDERKPHKTSFKWRHCEPAVILPGVRRDCRYQLSYRDVEEMMQERGLVVDHSTVFRWVQRFATQPINRAVVVHQEAKIESRRGLD